GLSDCFALDSGYADRGACPVTTGAVAIAEPARGKEEEMVSFFAPKKLSGDRPRPHGPRHRPALEELESRLVLSPPGTGWQLSFEDNFDGTSLDTSVWRVDTAPRRDARNSASALSVANGNLTITTYTSGGTHYTGFIDTRNSFLATFGYWEARIKYQGQPGMWSAFWVHSPT